MKKRILALALAGTTAFSVFGGVNAFAATASDAYAPYTPVKMKFKSDPNTDGNAAIVVTNGTSIVSSWSGTKTINNAANPAAVSNATDMASKVATFEELYALVNAMAVNYDGTFVGTSAAVENGYIYMYDYKITPNTANALYAAMDAFVTAYVDAANYAENTGFETSVANAKLDTLNKKENDFYLKLNAAYGVASPEVTNIGATTSPARNGAIADFEAVAKASAELDPEDYDSNDWADYNVAAMREFIAKVYGNVGGTVTSQLVYLTNVYNYLFNEEDGRLGASDPSEMQDKYAELMDQLSNRTEDDYTTANYKKFIRALEDAEDLAAEAVTYADWAEAYDALVAAKNVAVKKGDYKTLEKYLESLYTDYTIRGNVYSGKKRDKCVYLKEDYQTAAGHQTTAWDEAFVNDTYYTSYYTAAYDIYKDASKGYSSNVPQSDIDMAYDNLVAAIDALDASNGPSDWAILELETLVDEATSFPETDFYTTRSDYKSFVSAIANAEAVLAKANPGKNEVAAATAALKDAFDDVQGAKRSISSSVRKDLSNTMKDAEAAMKALDNQTGAQYLALQAALKAADDLSATGECLKSDLDGNGKRVAFISDYETATADLEAAIAGYEHPQGWYQNEEGTWFYGVGTENYTGWLELNGRTYFLKDDGSMAANTWVKTDAGYWYYLNASGAMLHDGWAKINDTWYFFKNFGGMAEGWVKDGNTWYYLTPGSGAMVSNGWSLINGKYYYFTESGAMLANTTTPDGYKVDASGAWVK